MKVYTVYWIKNEFAEHYYYKSDILYRFLREFHAKYNRNDLVTQFNFITESFPKEQLSSQLTRLQQNTFRNQAKRNPIELGNTINYITLHINEKHLKFRCETLEDAEALLFPILRRFHPYLFIMDEENENYGWISPVRTSIAYNNEEVLYS
ncbi:sporulation inhibitor of replication protein SirA [Ornithinibacillus xuwenensis]|uniref:Sporulation inhibitor of replication protein SirA n=1 Tax=Ornithinibacillus xuwenensis TaxID=3144668 RepID=A0ABU9XF81_9BACI